MIILIKCEDEIILKESQMDIDSVTNIIFTEFPKSNFFVIDNEYLKIYQYVKGSLKFKTEFNCGLFMIFEKYPEFVTEELITLCHDFPFDYVDYLSHIDDIKNGISKPIVIDKWKYKINIFDFDNIINKMEPTHNQKYLNWLCTIIYNNNILQEDYDKIKTLLEDFDNPQVKTLIKKAGYSIDIMDYENNNDLFKVINECYYSKLEDVEAGDRKILYQKRKVFEFRNWLVVVPGNHQEAVTLGRGTNWCTSADSEEGERQYNYYTKFGKLFIFVNKDNDLQKFQWSESTGDFLNWNDENFNVNEYFDLAFVEEFLYFNKKIPKQFKKFLGEFLKDKYFEFFIQTLPESNLINYIRSKDLTVINILLEDINILTYGVRLIIAEQGYGLDILINDKDKRVRRKVAEQGYGLDILINDESHEVRSTVAEQGYGLDILINDEDYGVRLIIAEQGYGLDILINDESHEVRLEVARQGYGLDILINDESFGVGVYVAKLLDILKNEGVSSYINDYGFKCYK